jgi:nicotinate-nucleotide adenylyltransferase
MNVGLLFGSFNPIHSGHLIIASIIKESTDLQQVWFIVSPQNPLKKRGSLLHEFDRLDMVRAAIYDNPDFQASDIEFNMPRPSYTVDTLTYLKERHPAYQFKVIMGEDNLSHFHKWKNHEIILNDYGLIVYPRPDVTHTDFKTNPNVQLVKAPLLDISATFIRKYALKGHSLRYLVPDPVEEIIRVKKFYQ